MEGAQATLNAVRALRSCVGRVFEKLGAGAGAAGAAAAAEREREPRFLAELQEALAAASAALRDAEQCAAALQAPPGPFALGNAALLSQEVAPERQALYAQLVDGYRWTEKIHEYGGSAQALLSQNSLKRSYVTSGSTKRRRTQTGGHNVPPHGVDGVIGTIDRSFADMKIAVSRPLAGGGNCVAQVTLAHALRALVAFKGLMIERVVVKGHGEPLDLWTESRHRVFRKVTDNAHAAMLHFYSPTLPELAVRSFMTWFHSFVNLFGDACKRCGHHLRDALPPTWRDFRSLEPFHEECKQ